MNLYFADTPPIMKEVGHLFQKFILINGHVYFLSECRWRTQIMSFVVFYPLQKLIYDIDISSSGPNSYIVQCRNIKAI